VKASITVAFIFHFIVNVVTILQWNFSLIAYLIVEVHLLLLNVQSGPQKWGHYVQNARKCRFILNTSIDSIFITQSGATWRKLTTLISLSTNAKGSSA